MKDLYYKYAHVLLEKGLCIKSGEPLLVNAPVEAIDFIDTSSIISNAISNVTTTSNEVNATIAKQKDKNFIEKFIGLFNKPEEKKEEKEEEGKKAA